ncbi:MAG: hotdog fold thioesterase [Xanthomonadales bacterium]|nr:hotdog fold thioesterase [Xanthomonadales bacterium]
MNPLERIHELNRHEPYAGLLGIETLEIRAGYARVAMSFRPDMQNIFAMLHGGAVFSLLDEAFQLACNARGEGAVALQVNTYFLAAANPGARLTAEAVELNATRKTALYDICVYEENDEGGLGRKLATAQALAYRKGGSLSFKE